MELPMFKAFILYLTVKYKLRVLKVVLWGTLCQVRPNSWQQ
jgi:hypothetical protein